MLENINEPVDIACRFTCPPSLRSGDSRRVGSKLIPTKFLWHGREIIVKKVNLAYSNREGRGKFYYFAVSDGANYFKLRFDSDKLTWILLETYVD
ncbi:MAG: hypothetical protein A3B10_04030 [Candidatus Doudnabacteria bacterium RIFCSPLOWO2_01_FULL_44_21]|uniref:Uncharacterized protein n=1 Tax=Candidatus Doudnabacteria bacterium RIFCSPLOWO2_01_FULL_44_21 TaxID=1817841 RepID=A0A1F5Q585_9BACT|nr:MAG: hypothetical protein A3B95_00730 [Candidatus Doudnabacteria bacterium RIFCSPHIGHO2_02_FULL_43_13b]OGE97287.1 MAG: hypothetical protein A3B10_04030 [Candidatus Doudnabacteria bacterium RIFCSPLOWO2_01_FULL_44_21]